MDNLNIYNQKVKEVLSRFSPEFREKYRHSATAHTIVDALAHGQGIYSMIEMLIQQTENANNTLYRLMTNSPVCWTTEEALKIIEK